MGTLADTLGGSKTVTVKGMQIEVDQLCLDDLFDCMREAFRRFDTPPESVDNAAQEAIESGRIPLTATPLLIAKACAGLDADDIKVLTGTGNLDQANKVAAVAMGLSDETDADDDGNAGEEGDGKKN